VLFVDDDMEPMPDLVREHMDTHAAHPRSVVVGPLASLPYYAQPWVAWEQLKLEAQYAAMQRGDFEPTFRQFWTGNASLSRREFLDAGGFDVTLLRGEDVELGFRLSLRKMDFRFNPRAKGLHHAQRSLASWEHAHKSYGRMEVDLFGREGEPTLLAVLAQNWNRLHVTTQQMVRFCAGRPGRTRHLAQALRGGLALGRIAPRSKPILGACSLLANLLYWDACLTELGPERTARMFARAAKQRQ
jgi:hypothetical protein